MLYTYSKSGEENNGQIHVSMNCKYEPILMRNGRCRMVKDRRFRLENSKPMIDFSIKNSRKILIHYQNQTHITNVRGA